MSSGPNPLSVPMKLLLGFIAGFAATFIFHQLTLALLFRAGIAPFAPFSMAVTKPFGVPTVISLAFWGGVWGILFAPIHDRFAHGASYWLISFLFGAILPSGIALIVVLPLKGRPMGGGWHPPLLLTAFLVNGFWGAGTGLIIKVLCKPFKK
ncbi:MAG TPA: hypothetical protein VMT62_05065 [Syntrophorhabdaceae bacterium]|nr:hypothetical protein [Syntrophorhabdaceae bacterium]